MDTTELLASLLRELSLILDLLGIVEQVAQLLGLVLELGALNHTALLEREVLEGSNLVEVILEILNNSGRAVLDQVVHDVDGFGDAAPLFGLQSELLPEVLHDDLVVLPVVGMVSQQLQLGIGDVPRILRGALHEYCAVLNLFIHLVLDLVGSLVNLIQHFDFSIFFEFSAEFTKFISTHPIYFSVLN